MNEQKREDFAEVLRKHFAMLKRDGKSRFKMSERNRRKLERIKERVAEMRGR